MKRIIYAIALLVVGLPLLNSCSKDDSYRDVWEDYRDWRNENLTWLAEQETVIDDKTGEPFYTKVVAPWNPGSYVLFHRFNDPAETAGNLTPMLTSTVTVTYQLHLYNGELADDSKGLKGGVLTSQLSSLISGWHIAMSQMHVGDTVQVVVPYTEGYGAQSSGNVLPYSVLRFNIKLKDIPHYETRP